MLETFNVLRIDEPDFGCEGRPDGMEDDRSGKRCPVI